MGQGVLEREDWVQGAGLPRCQEYQYLDLTQPKNNQSQSGSLII